MRKIFLTLGLAAALFSCEDATEIIQPSEFGFDTAFQNADDVKTAVFGIYGNANRTTGIAFTSYFTDECGLGEAGNNGNESHRLQLNVNNAQASGIWTGYNSAIRNANIFFEGAALVTPADAAEQATYDEALGEAHALRAYAYSQLLAYFAQDLSDPSSLAVPVYDFVPGVEDRLPRNTVAEVVQFINDDLDAADNLLTQAGTAYTVDFISLDFVNALRARVAAYVGDYPRASNFAQAVLGNFTLPTTADAAQFTEVWQDINGTATSQEVIFKFNNTLAVGSSMGQIWNTNSSDVTGSPLYEVGRRLFNELESNSSSFGDIRRQVWVDPSSLISPDYPNATNPREDDILVVDKYPGDPSLPGLVGGYTNDQKVFRTAEMHFILAEAAVENGDLPGAAAQLKIVRDARYTSPQAAPTYSSATEAWADIMAERYIELAFEGHRYIDVKRLGALANQGYDRNDTDCSLYPAPECDISFNDFRARALPVPAVEVRGNPTITQNDGY